MPTPASVRSILLVPLPLRKLLKSAFYTLAYLVNRVTGPWIPLPGKRLLLVPMSRAVQSDEIAVHKEEILPRETANLQCLMTGRNRDFLEAAKAVYDHDFVNGHRTSAYTLSEIPDVYFSGRTGDLYSIRHKKVIELSSHYNRRLRKNSWEYRLGAVLRSVQQDDSRPFVVPINAHTQNNIFHWIIEFLPRLYFLDQPRFRNAVLAIPEFNLRRPYQAETVRCLLSYYPELECRPVPEDEIWALPRVLMPSYVTIRHMAYLPEKMSSFLRRVFGTVLDFESAYSKYPELLYISRQDNPRRRNLNELELISALSAVGFTAIQPEKLDPAEQMRHFASARMVVAPHGAALASLVFCRPGTSVIEIVSRNSPRTSYATLSASLQLDYQVFYGTPANPDEVHSVRHGFYVDCGKLLQLVQQEMKKSLPQSSGHS